jgi:hypothetical protein
MNIDKAFFLITGLEPFFFNPKLKFVFQRAIQKIFFLILRIKNNYLFIFQNSDDLEIFVAKKIVARTQVALIRGNGINTEYFSYRHRDISSKFIFVEEIYHMILIADSGSTKCNWAACSNNGEIIQIHTTVGFNPKYTSDKNLLDAL